MEKRLKKLEQLASTYQAKLQKFRNWRLLVGLLTIIFFFTGSLSKWTPFLFFALMTLAIFYFVLVAATRKLDFFISQLQHLRSFYQRTELRKQAKHFHASPPLNEHSDQLQTLAMDLHLTGKISLLGLLDETITEMGQKKLVLNLIDPKMDRELILNRQKTIKQMARNWWSLLRLKVASMSERAHNLSEIEKEIKRPLIGSNFQKVFTSHLVLFFIVWGGITLNFIYGNKINPMIFFTVYLFYSLATRSQIASVFQRSHDIANHLMKLKPVADFIEHKKSSALIQKYFSQALHLNLSSELKNLSRWTAFLSVQAHPLVHIVLNSLCPWDYIFSYLTEKWRMGVSKSLPSALEELADFEVLMCQTLFYHFHTQTFPSFSQDNSISFESLRHPLINQKSSVENSFSKNSSTKLIIITGSNMSGKSTFLRTFGVNHTLALMGCPIFAKSFQSPLLPIRSCLKVHDSLEQGLSTFYYEVKQVADMINSAKEGKPFIYLIDEIFRGTNNKERLIGSQAVIRELLSFEITGFISTHDLELTHLAEKNTNIKNYHFRDDVSDDVNQGKELIFSYKIQPGPCPTTNALKIIAREGIRLEL